MLIVAVRVRQEGSDERYDINFVDFASTTASTVAIAEEESTVSDDCDDGGNTVATGAYWFGSGVDPRTRMS